MNVFDSWNVLCCTANPQVWIACFPLDRTVFVCYFHPTVANLLNEEGRGVTFYLFQVFVNTFGCQFVVQSTEIQLAASAAAASGRMNQTLSWRWT